MLRAAHGHRTEAPMQQSVRLRRGRLGGPPAARRAGPVSLATRRARANCGPPAAQPGDQCVLTFRLLLAPPPPPPKQDIPVTGLAHRTHTPKHKFNIVTLSPVVCNTSNKQDDKHGRFTSVFCRDWNCETVQSFLRHYVLLMERTTRICQTWPATKSDRQ